MRRSFIVGPKSRSTGFSLLELMIVVAVVGILAAIAYPSYRDYVKRGKRAAAQTVLLDLASRQQLFLLDKRRYAVDMDELLPGFTTPAEISNEYEFDVVGVNPADAPPTFDATATAKTGSMMAGDSVMGIDEAGTKSPTDYWKK